MKLPILFLCAAMVSYVIVSNSFQISHSRSKYAISSINIGKLMTSPTTMNEVSGTRLFDATENTSSKKSYAPSKSKVNTSKPTEIVETVMESKSESAPKESPFKPVMPVIMDSIIKNVTPKYANIESKEKSAPQPETVSQIVVPIEPVAEKVEKVEIKQVSDNTQTVIVPGKVSINLSNPSAIESEMIPSSIAVKAVMPKETTKPLESEAIISKAQTIPPSEKLNLIKEESSNKENKVLENFSDNFVECVSEGASEPTKLTSQDAVVSDIILTAGTSKNLNFNDDDTLCTSEGGTWTVSASKVPSTVINAQGSYQDANIGEILKLTAQKISFIAKLVAIENNAAGVSKLCDMLEEKPLNYDWLDIWFIKSKRNYALEVMLIENRENYIKTVEFFGERIPRNSLPNVQGVAYPNYPKPMAANGDLVPDCILPDVKYSESIVDKVLLNIFRRIVRREINFKSSTKGIRGLLEEGRHYMLSEEGTPENQHKFVKNTLAKLMTPALPPFYRLFMAGIVPSAERGDPDWLVSITDSIRASLPESLKEKSKPGKQLGPLFYAPALTSVVTPPLMNFLLGPSHTNRRKDGQLGGMVVEKCKFLQESGCKGLCLHQCKIPAQEFFSETLGVPLTVSPNFETQECQWSWGEVPLPADQDPTFPSGCLAGCATRSDIVASKLTDKSTICSA